MLYVIKSKANGNVIVRTTSLHNLMVWYRGIPHKDDFEIIKIKVRKEK